MGLSELQDTLSNIQKDIRKHTHQIEATAAEAQSLQSRIPSIKIGSESIFNKDAARLSLFEAPSNFAPSELDFQFDDLVINSSAYRRAFAKAHTENQKSHKQVEDDPANPDSNTPNIREFKLVTPSNDTPRGISQITLSDTSEAAAEDEGLYPKSQSGSLNEATGEETYQTAHTNGSDSQDLLFSQDVSQLVCNKCSVDITGRCVSALGNAWHPNCFVCYVSSTIRISEVRTD
ncbi:hypothetical protein J7337_011290 [Fusarium musae]|uniref:LIM zinc-binding domain-containing protein n=1 Tax=Fusarium musae TaxID=1042133 RepID=A0A9P8D719_9HYPO|nr:hypothetical protein J7337_011290 [Fusarium musae]KAG9496514.1 hypothetical protein J7337_011290 [Fusarium musae]